MWTDVDLHLLGMQTRNLCESSSGKTCNLGDDSDRVRFFLTRSFQWLHCRVTALLLAGASLLVARAEVAMLRALQAQSEVESRQKLRLKLDQTRKHAIIPI